MAAPTTKIRAYESVSEFKQLFAEDYTRIVGSNPDISPEEAIKFSKEMGLWDGLTKLIESMVNNNFWFKSIIGIEHDRLDGSNDKDVMTVLEVDWVSYNGDSKNRYSGLENTFHDFLDNEDPLTDSLFSGECTSHIVVMAATSVKLIIHEQY